MSTQLASRSELDALKTVNDVREWIGLAQDVWDALDATLGKVPNLRVLALLPPGTLQQSIASTRVEQVDGPDRLRKLSIIEAHQARIMRSLARQKFNLPDEDPLEELLPIEGEEEEPARPAPSEPAAAAPLPAPPAASAEVPRRPVPEVPPVPQAHPIVAVRAQAPEEDRPARLPPSVQRIQIVEPSNFYLIHRNRGLHLGPRFRAVRMAGAAPGSCFAALRPQRPARRVGRPTGAAQGANEDRWWRDFTQGAPPPPVPPRAERQEPLSSGGRRSKKNLWPGGKVPKDGLGLGLIPELHKPIASVECVTRQAAALIVSKELLSGGGLVLPARAACVPGTLHPATLDEEEEDEWDEPWSFLPGLYDAILTCTFLASNPVPGASTSQLPLPALIRDFRVMPNVSTNTFFGHCHPAEDKAANHYFDIATEEGIPVASIDGFEARAVARPAVDSKTMTQAAATPGRFQGYIYRTASSSPSRSLSPAPARGGSRGGATAGSASTRTGSRGRSSTPGARGRRTTQETGSASLTQAEREEVRARVDKWSRYVR
mmetsp:Transcript_61017/g.181797  ORF Transcript_61017/g.181797 Transcript_61017/m.181797 type:complete len:546 (-) Transcript_61017:184-1821(-)|eukprot:CAMPEP_0175361570 /NCGR_PEP_ID=MMETSP0095-20121207/16628_1 /TAXON_ID=311494 /ORGANISM="Alexandrium monilatum, Strain CCMP3105" /LENGTH=545 /DNA_ID=CAMNT_0016659427 /DNA_START=1 /DNA_END=1638 /DNA_ORIENTATION=-